MIRRALLCLLLAAAPALADGFDGDFDLRGREDLGAEVDVRLRLTPAAGGRVAVERRARRDGAPDLVLSGTGERVGDLLRVRFALEAGLSAALNGGQAARPLLGVYRLEGDRLRGLLQSPDRALGWSYTLERGARRRPAGFSPAGELAFKRVVLCLDGAAWRVVDDLQRRGHFRRFSAPARMISVYPSLSSIAWSALLGLPREPGYQAVYYANALGETMGVTARKMQGSRFQTRMHHRYHGLIGHGLAYVAPFLVGRQQLRTMIRGLIDHEGSRTAFMYVYQTDPIAHMNGRGDLERILIDVDREVEALMDAFRARTGEPLEVALVSDHGHTLVSGELVRLERFLDARGWKVVKEVRRPNECAFTSAGILSSITLHCQEAREVELARLVAGMEGVDVCTWDVGGTDQRVLSPRGEGRFTYDAASDRYGYEVVLGQDPIDYAPVFARLRAAGQLDAQGRAPSRALFEATADHAYPDAAHRIRTGHGELVWSPANVIVSLRPGFENGQGIVKATAALRGRSGTHGGLDQVNSAGCLLTTFPTGVRALRPEDLGRHVDLNDYLRNDPPLELSIEPSPAAPGRGALTLEVEDHHALARSPLTTYRVSLRRSRFLLADREVWGETYGAASLRREDDTVVLPLAGAYERLAEGKGYSLVVRIEHRDVQGQVRHSEERKLRFGHRGTYQVAD